MSQNSYALWQVEATDPHTDRTLRRIVWQRKSWIALIVILFAGVGAAYVQYGTPIYSGSARILLQELPPVGASGKRVVTANFVDTQAQVLSSPVLVRDAVTALNLPELDPRNVEGLLLIMDSLSVTHIPQTDVVSVSYRSENPETAVTVVASLIRQFQDYLVSQQSLTQETAPGRPEIQKVEEELWKAQADQKALAERYGDKHPEMRAAQEKIAHWQAVLKQVKPDVEPVQKQTALNESMLAKTGGVKIAILDGPVLAEKPVWPNPLLVMPVAIMLGLMAGFGAVVFFDRGDDSLRSTADLEMALETRACGQIPGSGGSGMKNIHRYALEAPNSALARAAYGLTQELFDGPASQQGPIVQVTSAREQSGKTTLVANLAFSLAQQGKKVCVVDADLRHGILHRVFDVSPAKGLSALTRTRDNELDSLLQTSPLAPIDVLTKGPAVRNPLHLLAQPQVEKALEALRWQYDIVLLDTPPLLRLSDASLLAPLADKVLVVLQSGVSSASSVRRALNMLNSVGAKNVGLVLNGSPIEPWMVDGEATRFDARAAELSSVVSLN